MSILRKYKHPARRFGGKLYIREGHHRSKEDAEREQRKWRERGHNARVTGRRGSWYVWATPRPVRSTKLY